jgi:hypothetical protein
MWLKSKLEDWNGWGTSSEWKIPIYQKWYSTLNQRADAELEDKLRWLDDVEADIKILGL